LFTLKSSTERLFLTSDHSCRLTGSFQVEREVFCLCSLKKLVSFLLKVVRAGESEPGIFCCPIIFLATLPLSHSGSPCSNNLPV
jgi:hypothetical protein